MDYETLKNCLGIVFDKKTKENFIKYIECFNEYNSHTNLISKNDEKLLFEKHIFDSLALNLVFEKYGCPKSILDIGTGGGFPSVPLAIAFDKINITAVDSINKKIKFIEEVKKGLGLKNIEPFVSRIEELPENYREKFDIVTTRALSGLNVILEYAIPYLKVGGYFVAFKSQDSENELKNAKNTMKVLNVKLVDTIEYKLPLNDNFDRKFLIFQKLKQTQKLYPRQNGIIKKNPL